MKRILAALVIILLVVSIAPETSALRVRSMLGQDPEQIYNGLDENEKLYVLKGNSNDLRWSELVRMNPSIKRRSWMDEKKRIIVLIRSGERLQGLEELGLTMTEFSPPWMWRIRALLKWR